MLAWVDMGANSTLLHGNPDRFWGPFAVIWRVQVRQVTVTLRIGHLPPHQYAVYVPLIVEYILGVDVLHCLTMQIK